MIKFKFKNYLSDILLVLKKMLFWRWQKNKNTGVIKEAREKQRISRMKITSIIFISYRNLMANKLRSILTIGGVVIGIGIVTFLICIGFGMQKMIVNEVVKENPVNIIDIDNGNLDNFVSLDSENIKRIKEISGVENVATEVNTGGKIYYKESQTDMVIYGINKDFFALSGSSLAIKHGKIDYEDEGEKIAVSSKVANLLGFENPVDIIGKRIKFDIILSRETNSQIKEEVNKTDNEAEVVAVVALDESATVFIPSTWLNEKFGIDLAQRGKVKVDLTKGDINEIRKNIEFLGFETESVNDIVNDINSFFWVIRIVLMVFGTIIMSISAMGMLNTLSVSLLQRTKEVGILKALGAKRKDIFRMFIFEAAIISFIGGALGFISGYGLAKILNEIFNILANKRGIESVDFIYIPFYFMVILVGLIAFLGLVTGIMPARRAARIHALIALRYE